jgi:hypothetical protein
MRRVTRPSNANAHPGMIQRGAPKRTSQQVQADEEAKAAAKEKTAAHKKANIQKVAELEVKLRKKVKETDHQANNPADKPTIGKRTRMEEMTVTNGMVRIHRWKQNLPAWQVMRQIKPQILPATTKLPKGLENRGKMSTLRVRHSVENQIAWFDTCGSPTVHDGTKDLATKPVAPRTTRASATKGEK